MTDRSVLSPLLELQRIDSTIDKLRARQAAMPEQAALDQVLEAQLELVPVLKERRDALNALKLAIEKIDGDTGLIRIRLEREQKRFASGSVTSPREITSLQAEISSLERRISTLEDDELELMEQSETIAPQVEEFEARFVAVEEQVQHATRARDTAAASISAELGSLTAARATLIASIEPKHLDRYEKARTHLGGIAIAGYDGKLCAACGLPLSPGAREEIKASDDLFVTCENCRRILVPA